MNLLVVLNYITLTDYYIVNDTQGWQVITLSQMWEKKI